MRKLFLGVLLYCLSLQAFGQATATVYCLSGTDSSGFATSFGAGAPTYGNMNMGTVFGNASKGFAVFNLGAIPAGATITGATVNFNVATYNTTFGAASGWNTLAFASDLATITTNAALYTALGSGGTSISTATYGAATGNQTVASNAAGVTFFNSNIGNTISLGFTESGAALYTFTGAAGTHTTTGAHAPYLQITYCPPALTGTNTVCTGNTVSLSDVTTGGTWTSSPAGIANVVAAGASVGVTGLSAGVVTVSYTLGTCPAVTAKVTVNPTPAVISGPATICTGVPVTYTDATGGGSWTSSAPGVATIDAVTGFAGGLSAGSTNFAYTIASTGCSTSTTVVVNNSPSSIFSSGSGLVCLPSGTDTLFNLVPGGGWTSSNTAVATFTAVGADTVAVIPAAPGTANITYSIGSCTAIYPVTVSTVPTIGIISGPANICLGAAVTLTNTPAGGTWSASNGTGTITSISSDTIALTGSSIGIDTITYSIVNSCGSATNTQVDSIGAVPVAGVISGPLVFCAGTIATFSDPAVGGVWSLFNGNAINTDSVVTGVSAGTDTAYYTVTTACSTAVAKKFFTIDALPDTGVISGNNVFCVGASDTLFETVAGGTWSYSNANVATVASAFPSDTSLFIGMAAGLDTIYYTVSNTCGPLAASFIVTVNPISAGSIVGATSLCVNDSIALTNPSAPGGVWSSTGLHTAITTAGVVTGLSSGMDTISYAVTNVCGTHSTFVVITVNPLPSAGGILGWDSVCAGGTLPLTATVAGGTWSSMDTTLATVSTTGTVTGVAAGVAVISYGITGAFGCIGYTTKSITVNAVPVVNPITGAPNECVGMVTLLSNSTVPAGAWSSSLPAVASVDSIGNVHGLSGGTTVISYTVVSAFGCSNYATYNFAVDTFPAAVAITGVPHVCLSQTQTLTNTGAPGFWMSTDNSVAIIDSFTGVYQGISSGTDLIEYIVTNGCGSIADSILVTVDTIPVVPAISGPSTVICAGGGFYLTDAQSGGVWSSSNTTIASVNSATGAVYGLGAGAAVITYAITDTHGCSNYNTIGVTFGGFLSAYVTPSTGTICHGTPVPMHVVSTSTGLTYQWYDNGVAVAGATNSSYIADVSGNYTALVNNGTCTETISGTTVSNQPNPVIETIAPNILYTGSFHSYQWYVNGLPISGATSSIYFESGSGTYSVVVEDGNGCTDTASQYVVAAYVENIGTNNNVVVYPNPTTSALFVKSNDAVTINISSIDGKLVKTAKGVKEISLAELAEGVYLVHLFDLSGNLIQISRVVKVQQ
jgi:trimeric autotransporter adhesin